MSEPKQTKKLDTVIIAVCLLLLISCGFILSSSSFFNGDDDTSKLKAVGTISSTSHDVRRRHQDGLSWNSASRSDTVYEGDSVYTGDISKADISLQKGGKLTLDPKSLVVIRTEGGNLTLDLKYGAFGGKVSGDQNIIVINNGERSVISGNNAQIRIEQKKGEKSKVHVISGELKIKDTKGQVQTVKKDEDVPIQLQEEKKPEIVVARIAPIPVIPTQNQLFITNETQQGRTIGFSWNDNVTAKNYTIEVSKTADFADPILHKDLVGQALETDKLVGGAYFWRVRGENQGLREPIWSRAVPFQVLEHSAMKAPTVTKTTAPFIIPFALVDLRHVDPKTTSLKSPSNPSLSWAASPSATSYDVQVTDSAHFTDEQIIDRGLETSYQIQNLHPGVYSYRVRAHLPAGQKTETSAVAVLKVQLPAPVAHKSLQTLLTHKIGWSPLLFADSYEVQVSPDLTFKTHKAILNKTGHEQVLKSLYAKQGGLHWRVRALNAERVPISDFSEPQTLREQVLIPIAKKTVPVIREPANDDANDKMMVPLLIEPRPDTSVLAMAQKSSGYISFKWKAQQDDGAKYRLEVSQTPDFKNPVITRTTPAMNSVVVQRFPAGQMYWRVRQESAQGHSRWAAPNSLTVTPAK